MGLTTKQKSDLAKTIATLTKEAHGKTGAGVPMVYCAAEKNALIGACAATSAAVLSAAEETARRNSQDIAALFDLVQGLEEKMFGARK